MIHSSRIPATLTLLLVLAPGGVMLYARHANTGLADESRLAALQAAVARPDASAQSWLIYAQTLQSLKHYPQAAWAYRQLLEMEPTNRQARLQSAVCLASADNRDELLAFIRETILCDPKLAAELFGRPELQTYLADPRFQALQREAISQSMD